MCKNISLESRKELLNSLKLSYQIANWEEKIKILDNFVSSTGYTRKHAITLLNKITDHSSLKRERLRSNRYDSSVREALIIIWHAANKICSKRLVPFLPDFIQALEKHGHLSLSIDVRNKLLTVSAATVDRLLKAEYKSKNKKNKHGNNSLLKKQIMIRTLSDWKESELIPGFMEIDLVAHCGNTTSGSFLNTLVITDIVSQWTEFMPLLCKGEANVVDSLKIAKKILPFPILGLDTDNGSEFINQGLLEYCKEEKAVFTRSRAYRKNDQAHVEEKNGSKVRRLVGYDRYEGVDAWHKLAELYSIMRLYVNFFQPCLKLISKERQGAKVSKRYDKAKTPYQRLMNCETFPEEKRKILLSQYKRLDPLKLLKELQAKQEEFWQYAWAPSSNILKDIPKQSVVPEIIDALHEESPEKLISLQHYKNTKKPRKLLEPRTWRTHKDPFERVLDSLINQLNIRPELTSKELLEKLISEYPNDFKINQLRSLQRRVSEWRKEQLNLATEHQVKLMTGTLND